MKITIAGTGYVGLSLATLLSQEHEVIALDIIQEKVDMINNKRSPIKDKYIEDFFKTKELNLVATTNKEFAYKNAELIIVATPTNYDEDKDYFDTSSVEDVIENVLKYNSSIPIIIKSTIPVGYVNTIRYKYKINNVYFSPEFLREGKALEDNLYPSRIIVGDKGEVGEMFSSLLKSLALNEPEIILTDTTEAEAIKLFANTYLAMRVAYFNELDNYAISNRLNTEDIIKGISLDPRIGNYYNNPSFGFSGYCLPKDTRQLLANFERSNTNQELIGAIVESNETRKDFIVKDICSLWPSEPVGIYKTAMKAGSDNNRSSSIIDVIKKLRLVKSRDVIIYEPYNDVSYLEKEFGCRINNDFDSFVEECSVIITNRLEPELEQYKHKIYTRDVFNEN